jgi:hypothetical protein
MTPPSEALHLIPSEPAETARPSAEARSVSPVRDQANDTLAPKALDGQLTQLKEKLDKGEFDPSEAHTFLDRFDRFLSTPPYGGVGLDPMVTSLYEEFKKSLSVALACNTLAQMTGQQEYLEQRAFALAEKVHSYAEKAGEEANRTHSP